MIIKTKFKGLLIYKNKIFKDKRGYFKELVKERIIKKKLPFTVMSYSKKNVIRGLHIQTKKPQGKFISVLKGKIYDVALDLRKNSSTFGKVFSCIISEENSKSIYIPPGFAHGFCGLDKENYIIYSCSQYRDEASEKAIKYNDKKLRIKWPTDKPMVSKKDKNAIEFCEFKKKYL
tara:strand:+ start:11 stop:535 length:525 start_codon:yes stop_codon:yes gene_type:complete